MAYIILPSRRTRQPQTPVRVIPKWIDRGMVASYNPAIGTKDLARNNNGTIVGNIVYDSGAQGRAWKGAYQYSNNYIHASRGSDFAYVSGFTFEALVVVSAFQTTVFPYITGVIGQYANQPGTGVPAPAPFLRFNHDAAPGSAALPTVSAFKNGTEYRATGSTQSVGVPIHLIGLYNGANVVLWVNCVKTVGGAFTGSMDNDVESYIQIMSDYTRQDEALIHSRCLNGKMFFANIYNRGLTDAECIERFAYPWGHLAPDPRRLYFAPSGGGATIFESTFADSWSLSDTYSASANLVSTYADSPTVTDSSSSSAVFASAFDETIPVSDGPSADMGGVANRTQEESFTITDAYSASMVANATISETLSAEASASAAAIFNAIFAETLPIVDGEEADAGRISDIAENVTVTDAYTAGIVAQATQAESVTTIDTYDTIAIYNPLLAETLPITDTVGATLTVPTSGTVDLSQESIDSLAHEIMVQLTSTPVRKL